jgi:hypothetical protein
VTEASKAHRCSSPFILLRIKTYALEIFCAFNYFAVSVILFTCSSINFMYAPSLPPTLQDADSDKEQERLTAADPNKPLA